MRKQVLSVFVPLFLVCIFSLQAIQAAEQRLDMKPELFFDGTTAVCSGSCRGNSPTDNIAVTLTLYQSGTYIDSWSKSGSSQVLVSGECNVKSGKAYRLEMVCTINGVTKPTASTTGTCP